MSSKGQNLTAATSLANTDILYGVATPGTVPADRKVPYSVVKNSLQQYVLYADTFTGTGNDDMGDKINTAYAALPATGGVIIVPGGNYNFSTPIVFNTAAKHVQLRGTPTTGTTLTYTGGTTTVALQYNVAKEMTAGHGIEDIKFIGPGSLGSTCGLLLGGLGADDSKGAAGIMVRNVHVRGFGCGIVIGNNTYLMTLDNCVINFNRIQLFEKGGAGSGATDWTVNGTNTINSGENMRVLNCLFADSNNQLFGESTARYAVHLQCSGLTDWQFIGVSFDDSELYIDKTGGTANEVHVIACHFENPAGNSIGKYTYITTLAASPSTILNVTDSAFVQAATTSKPDQFISCGGEMTAIGCTAVSNGGTTVSQFVNLTGGTNAATLVWAGFKNVNTPVTYVVGTTAPTNSGFADGAGAVMTITDQGKITFYPSTTAGASMNLPVGTAPTSPNDGDIWRADNTNTGLKVRINGVTKTVTVS